MRTVWLGIFLERQHASATVQKYLLSMHNRNNLFSTAITTNIFGSGFSHLLAIHLNKY
jgi:hypothetical protein